MRIATSLLGSFSLAIVNVAPARPTETNPSAPYF
jgi:hypothetical protein